MAAIMPQSGRVELVFDAVVWEWRGPAPYYFVSVPDDDVEELAVLARAVTYGWGMVPATVRIGATSVTTSLWPRGGGYAVPLKDALRRPEGVGIGDTVTVTLTVDG